MDCVLKKSVFCIALGRATKEVPENEQLFKLMDANAHTGRMGGRGPKREECDVLGAYARDTLNDNGDRI